MFAIFPLVAIFYLASWYQPTVPTYSRETPSLRLLYPSGNPQITSILWLSVTPSKIAVFDQ